MLDSQRGGIHFKATGRTHKSTSYSPANAHRSAYVTYRVRVPNCKPHGGFMVVLHTVHYTDARCRCTMQMHGCIDPLSVQWPDRCGVQHQSGHLTALAADCRTNLRIAYLRTKIFASHFFAVCRYCAYAELRYEDLRIRINAIPTTICVR